MKTSLRIAVTGLAVTYPFGGVFWDYLQYLLGFHRLGHDVLYIEDTGKWCYDPIAGTFIEDGSRNAAYLAREIKVLHADLADCWFYRDASGKTYGRPWNRVASFCRSADLFIHLSASCWMRQEYYSARRVAFIDTDPMYTQASGSDYLTQTAPNKARSRVNMQETHDIFFTFGENIGAPDCKVPTGLLRWLPTRQPIVLECFDQATVPVSVRRRVMTTVASWEPTEQGPTVNGTAYGGKNIEFERFVDLPSRAVLPLEIAVSGRAPALRLQRHGWILRDGLEVSYNPWVYRDYLAHSAGEWSVAKNAYVASRSGWFSCRTACYLSLGVPAVVQNTGFGATIPTGEGLFAFSSLEEAAEAIAQIAANPDKHAAKARDIALEYFDSRVVLSDLLRVAFSQE